MRLSVRPETTAKARRLDAGSLLSPARGLEPVEPSTAPPATPGIEDAPPLVQLTSADLRGELDGVVNEEQLEQLAEAFTLVAEERQGMMTASLCELRALLRNLGCERVSTDVLRDLQHLDSYRKGQIRRPPLLLLQGLDLLHEADMPAHLTPRTVEAAEEIRVSYDDFIRIMTRGRMKDYLPAQNFEHRVETLTHLSAIFGLSTRQERSMDRMDLAAGCSSVGTLLSQAQMDQLWGILANADGMSAEEEGEGRQTGAHSGWLRRGGDVVKKRKWVTLSEGGRGRLQFRDEEHGPASDDFIEMADCVRVYHATGHRRNEFGRMFGRRSQVEVSDELRRLWTEFDTDKSGELDMAELRSVLSRMGTAVSDKKFAKLVKQIDRDKSGTISLEEFEFWWRKQSDEARNVFNTSQVDLDALWAEIDTDGNGSLDEQEFEAVLERMGQPIKPRKLKKLMKKLDTDNDGSVSQDEFMVWWTRQSDEARSQISLAEDEDDEDDDEEDDDDDDEPSEQAVQAAGGVPAQPSSSSSSTAIGLITSDANSRREKRHLLLCESPEQTQLWLQALESCRLFHHNYDRDKVSYGEFLLGMATVAGTPLAERFEMFATRRLLKEDGSYTKLERTGSALTHMGIDEARAEELYRNLGGLEKFGVWRSGVEQKKRDKNEMMARLQRKHDNQLHNLTPAEQMLMRKIERGVAFRCFLYGAISAAVSGACELIGGWLLDTSDGLHAGTSFLAPNATCEAHTVECLADEKVQCFEDETICPPLDAETTALYFACAIVLPIALAAVCEIGAIYWDTLRSAMRFVGVVGLQLLPLDDERLFIALSLTRAVLELGNPEDAMEGVLNPLKEVSRWRMLLCSLLYKARIGISNFVMKIGLKRVLSRVGLRAQGTLPFVAIVGTAIWNGLTARGLMTEARIRAMGVASAVELTNEIMDRTCRQELTPLGKTQAVRAIACTVVQKHTLHPNHHHLLLHILHRLSLDEEYRQSAAGREQDFDAARERTGYDDSGLFLQELPNLGPEEGKMVLALVCLAIVIDANANRASLRFYCSVIEGLSQGDVHYEDNSLHLEELALEFRKGKPLDTGEILDKAVGSAQQSEQLLRTGSAVEELSGRSCAANLAYWPWQALNKFVSCMTSCV